MVTRHISKLNIAFGGDVPPSEFRIFTAGTVDTVKGQFLFDENSAVSVMAEYEAHGIDIAVDYDHAMLNDRAIDPAQAGKAAGWFNLEVRGGELWAVNVRWTEPAAAALSRKEWRYMSPAFEVDAEGRVTSLLNVAITNLPATRKLQPLMAASVRTLNMNPDQVKAALDALIAGDAEKAAEILKGMIAEAASGEAAADAPVDAPVEMADVPAEEPAPDPSKEEEKAAIMAATSRLVRLTGKDTIAAAVNEVESWRQSHLKLEAETVKLAQERAAIELGQRKENAKKLILLGAETPHTSGLASNKLTKRLLDEPLSEQNERVAALLAAKGGKLPSTPKPPAEAGGEKVFETPHGTVSLSASELKACEDAKADPKVYAANKAFQIKARAAR